MDTSLQQSLRPQTLEMKVHFVPYPVPYPFHTRSIPESCHVRPIPPATIGLSHSICFNYTIEHIRLVAAMPPKSKKPSKTSAARKLERPKIAVSNALASFRKAAGDPSVVAKTVWSLLTHEELEVLQSMQEGAKTSTEESGSAGFTQVAKAVRSFAEGTSEEACAARSLLAKAGHQVLKKKRRAERALRMKFSRSMWAKVCSKNSIHKKRGRKSKVNDPEIGQSVRNFLVANSQIAAHYRKVGKDFVQCRALSRSKSKLWKLNPSMQALMSLTSWKRHLRLVHPQFTKFKKKVDVCPICHKYDKLVVPKVRKAVDGAMQIVLTVEKTYFAKLDAHRQESRS